MLYNIAGAPLWHQRLILGSVEYMGVSEDIIATPDGDVYAEPLREGSPDLAAVRLGGNARWPPPAGIPQAAVYRFGAEPTAVGYAALLREAALAADERVDEIQLLGGLPRVPVVGGALAGRRIQNGVAVAAPAPGPGGGPAGGAPGVVPVVGAPPAPVPAGGAPQPHDLVWAYVETVRRGADVLVRRGDLRTLDGTETIINQAGICRVQTEDTFMRQMRRDAVAGWISAEAEEDDRLLPLPVSKGSIIPTGGRG